MKVQQTIVITGGTDGIGKAVAEYYLKNGWKVCIVGRNDKKGQQFLEYAKTMYAENNARFIQADLSNLTATKRAIEIIKKDCDHIDALVLCAQYYNTRRTTTVDGLEHAFALYYLSRYLFSYELVPLLQAAKQPIILNVCGVGIKMGEIVWDDLQATNAYQGLEAIMQGSRLNDLLGVLFADQESTTGIKYVLFNPNGVSTNFSGSYDKEMKLQIEAAKKTSTPVSEGIRPMIEIISNPPEARLSAFIADKTFNIDELAFSKSDADRLEKITKEIIL